MNLVVDWCAVRIGYILYWIILYPPQLGSLNLVVDWCAVRIGYILYWNILAMEYTILDYTISSTTRFNEPSCGLMRCAHRVYTILKYTISSTTRFIEPSCGLMRCAHRVYTILKYTI
uniref:Uncharacterized protein n=1 Tax=Capsaspora owczarzaki TaxID=192875 RepID=M1JZF5_9EUKA|nr:hypothetical protein [Capsaspora owczarzaki]